MKTILFTLALKPRKKVSSATHVSSKLFKMKIHHHTGNPTSNFNFPMTSARGKRRNKGIKIKVIYLKLTDFDFPNKLGQARNQAKNTIGLSKFRYIVNA